MNNLVNIETEGTKKLQIFDFKYSKLSYFEKKDKLEEFKTKNYELFNDVKKIVSMRENKILSSDECFNKLHELKNEKAFEIFFLMIDVILHRYLYKDEIPVTNKDIDLSIVARYKFDMSSNIIYNNEKKASFIKNMDVDTYSKIKEFADVNKTLIFNKSINYDKIPILVKFFNDNELYKVLSPLMFVTVVMYLVMYVPSIHDTDGLTVDEIKVKIKNKLNDDVTINNIDKQLILDIFSIASMYILSIDDINLYENDNFLYDVINIKNKYNINIDTIVDIIILVVPYCNRANITDKTFSILDKVLK